MAHGRQSGGASGSRKVPRSLWERAGARVGDGAGALFARLDAQDAQDAQDVRTEAAGQTREHAALALERLAAEVRAGAWSAEIAALATSALELLDERRAAK